MFGLFNQRLLYKTLTFDIWKRKVQLSRPVHSPPSTWFRPTHLSHSSSNNGFRALVTLLAITTLLHCSFVPSESILHPVCRQRSLYKQKFDHAFPCLQHQQLPNAFRLKLSPWPCKAYRALRDLPPARSARFLLIPGFQNWVFYWIMLPHEMVFFLRNTHSHISMLIPTHALPPPGNLLGFDPPQFYPSPNTH